KEILLSSADVLRFYELQAIHGEDHVTAATVFDNRTGEETTLELDAIVLGLGFLANLGPIRQWGLELARNSILVGSRFETNLPGVYAVG
ncbi:MAG: FAD-dependent oxidoreductase, partial [Anaerolineae bacterium]|nr:FAD-dependent oxidoreductase [Anaerolineae bacterium]